MFRKMFAWTCISAVTSGFLHGQIANRALPDFGLMFNEDGDSTFVGSTQAEWETNKSNWMTSLALGGTSGLGADTVAYSVATGSDMLLYPSTAGTSWGWRNLDEKYATKLAKYQTFITAVRPVANGGAGMDGIKLVAKNAEAKSIKYIPLLRMNDVHFAAGSTSWSDIEKHPFTGEFWINHSGGYPNDPNYTQQVRPFPPDDFEVHKNLLDYNYAAVRNHRLAVINEVLDHCKLINHPFEGIELDFVRFQTLFSSTTPPTMNKAELITEMMRQIRGKLDSVKSQIFGRTNDLALIVRVPPTLANCEWAGLDVKQWLSEGLVDIVIPSQIQTLAHDQPLDEFIALRNPLNSPRGVKIYAGILGRNAFPTYKFLREAPEVQDFLGDSPLSAELVRGAAINYRTMGVDGFEMYNFPKNSPIKAVLRESLETALTQQRVYAITQNYWQDSLNTYENRKQIATLVSNNRQSALLYVGEEPDAIPDTSYLGLRFGITMSPTTASPDSLRVRLNGKELGPPDSFRSVDVQDRDGPKSYIQFDLAKEDVRQGWNTLTFEPGGQFPSASNYSVIEVQLGVIP